ncbi:MAG: hypothetical protein AAF597_17475, partial [Bacteroidota bacterium]
MKTIFYALTFLLLPITLTAQTPHNLDFEDEDSWLPRRLTQDNFYAKTPEGKGQCVTLTGPFTEYGSGYVYQEVPVSLSAAKRYTVSAKIRTRGVSARGAQVYVYGKVKGEMVGYRQSEFMTGDNDWTKVSFDLILDRAMDTLRLGCFLEGTGQAWFDDLTFTPYVAQ